MWFQQTALGCRKVREGRVIDGRQVVCLAHSVLQREPPNAWPAPRSQPAFRHAATHRRARFDRRPAEFSALIAVYAQARRHAAPRPASTLFIRGRLQFLSPRKAGSERREGQQGTSAAARVPMPPTPPAASSPREDTERRKQMHSRSRHAAVTVKMKGRGIYNRSSHVP